jgi:equilibrative nucleoside transporter 1/2/3
MNNVDDFLRTYFDSVMTIFSAALLIPNLLGLIYMTFIGHRFNSFYNLFLPYIFFIISIVIIPILSLFNVNKWIKFIITLLILISSGWSTAILEGELFGKSYMCNISGMSQMLMFGIGVIGIIVSITKIITKLVSGNIYYYFFISDGFMIISMISLIFLYILPLSRKNLLRKKDRKKFDYVDVYLVFKDLKGWCLQIFLIFFVSMSIFPGICTILPTSFPNSFMKDWYPIIMLTIFTTFDFIGRTLPNYIKFIKEYSCIRRITLLRINFLILFFMYIKPMRYIHLDFIPIIAMILMSFSNGYLSTIVMENGQLEIVEPHLKEVGGNLMTFSMLLGISTGSVSSIGLFYLNDLLYQEIPKLFK